MSCNSVFTVYFISTSVCVFEQSADRIEPTAPPLEPSETEVNSVNMCISELSEHLNESSSTNRYEQPENNAVDPSSFVTVIEVNGQKSTESTPVEITSTPPVVRKPPK